VQPKNSRVVELFNEALTLELTIVNSYFLNARMLDNWGFPKLGKVFYDLSIDEMKDADSIIQRILLFDGHPNVQRLNPIRTGETPEEMLRIGLEGEIGAVAQFNAAAKECHVGLWRSW
jgi:bacterioferritin